MADKHELVGNYNYKIRCESPRKHESRLKKYFTLAFVLNLLSVLMLTDYMYTLIIKNQETRPLAKRIDGVILNKYHDSRSKLILKNVLQNSELTVEEINQLNLDK